MDPEAADLPPPGIPKESPPFYQRGIVETPWLRVIPYEELAMAKIYQVIEDRVIREHPGAKTKGKSFHELTETLAAA